jgi:hypothetical protein
MAVAMSDDGYLLNGRFPLETDADLAKALIGVNHLEKTYANGFVCEWRLTREEISSARSFLKCYQDGRFNEEFSLATYTEWLRYQNKGGFEFLGPAGGRVLHAAIRQLSDSLQNDSPNNSGWQQWIGEAEERIGEYTIKAVIRDTTSSFDGDWSMIVVEFIFEG